MINVGDFSGMLEMINQGGMGKQCIKSEGVCVGLAWRVSLGSPRRLRTSWLRLLPVRMERVCGYLRAAPLPGPHARVEAPLATGTRHCAARSPPMASRHGHVRLNYLHRKDPGGVLEPLPETQE